jgi:hypothetical protein
VNQFSEQHRGAWLLTGRGTKTQPVSMELPPQLGDPAGTQIKGLGHGTGSLAQQQPVDDAPISLGSGQKPGGKIAPENNLLGGSLRSV